ncbi:N-acetylglucosaminyldiphosphoundecaprenol N-acetyl-beta-D-mannosaminyltransferase [Paenibacillus anaericanus]|uniref:WecB/TagA/CpsF family glycosyltransferase n=1 Tax=Paenibacillus anaericanus TaxID=170367 RepID=UPI00277F1A30|nr:WecB/TagA/CpsF family glycosyltransferase [Paenibacillus anaericanus]MDQ0087832.1 N-acetylglucosaminyldiphosphoundecaprenol N-acetyl-beta-D-mannosaminyltransferase [Paenibacillus anaericanus]
MDGSVTTILGVPFSRLTLEETTLHLTKHLQHEPSNLLHLITANPEITIVSQSDDLLRKIISEADLITPDGVGILMAARRKGDPIVERVTGYDLLLQLLNEGNQRGWSFYFLGTDEQTNLHAVDKIRQLYPNVQIAGRHHGFFTELDEPSILSEIEQTRPDILIVAMGAPYSDKWIYNHKQDIAHTKIVFGVGGSLDVIAGKVPPTPAIWKSLNLEWLHRLFTAPVAKGQKSRWRRQSALPKFVYRAIIRNAK